MGTRRWDQRDQPLEKLARLEDDVSRAVAPAALELVLETTVGLCCQPPGRDWRPSHIAAQALESLPVSRRDGHVRVQADAVDHGAACASRSIKIVGSNTISETRHAPAGAWASRGGAGPKDARRSTSFTRPLWGEGSRAALGALRRVK
jgi:hypothetical protein